MHDDDLLRRIHAGEQHAFIELTRHYGTAVGSAIEYAFLYVKPSLTDDELELATCLVLRIVYNDIRGRQTLDGITLQALILECTRHVARMLRRYYP